MRETPFECRARAGERAACARPRAATRAGDAAISVVAAVVDDRGSPVFPDPATPSRSVAIAPSGRTGVSTLHARCSPAKAGNVASTRAQSSLAISSWLLLLSLLLDRHVDESLGLPRRKRLAVDRLRCE